MYYTADDPEDKTMKPKVFNWEPTVGTENYVSSMKEFDYTLELDYSDRIIGGKWEGHSKMDHPDLFWKTTKQVVFSREFAFINKIYQPNTTSK